MLFRPALPFATAACAALLLAACGGGSDSSAPPPSQPVAITAANEVQVGSAAVSALDTAGGLGLVTVVDTGSRVTAAAKSSNALSMRLRAGSLGQVLQRFTADAVLAPLAKGAAVTTQATRTFTDTCPGGGTATLTLNDNDNNQVASAGDTGTIAFAACAFDGITVNGSLTVTWNTVSVTGSTRAVSASVAYNALSVSVAGEGSFVVNGSASASLTDTDTTLNAQLVIGAGGLTATVTSVSPAFTQTLALGAGLTLTASEGPTSSTATLNGAISFSFNGGGTAISGGITVETVTPFTTVGSDLHPSSGQLVVTGANNSRLRLTAVSNTQVRIEIDTDGNGTYERDNLYNWSQLH